MFVVGVDGCRAGWVIVALEDGRFAGASMFESFAALCEALPDAAAIAVDIPIGLPDGPERRCDALVRAYVGRRHASVFPTPGRSVLSAPNYERANELSRELAGRGVSRQSYGLARKILEVDRVVRAAEHQRPSVALGLRPVSDRLALVPPLAGEDEPAPEAARPGPALARESRRGRAKRFARVIPNPAMRRAPEAPAGAAAAPDPETHDELPGGRIVEAHPEACFRALAGAPLEHAKSEAAGLELRHQLLARVGIVLPVDRPAIAGVARDDLLDAAAVAWTADRYARGVAYCFPPSDEWQRDAGRVVAIWL